MPKPSLAGRGLFLAPGAAASAIRPLRADLPPPLGPYEVMGASPAAVLARREGRMTAWLKRPFRPAAPRDADLRADASTTRFVKRRAHVEIGSDGHLRVEDKPADDDA